MRRHLNQFVRILLAVMVVSILLSSCKSDSETDVERTSGTETTGGGITASATPGTSGTQQTDPGSTGTAGDTTSGNTSTAGSTTGSSQTNGTTSPTGTNSTSGGKTPTPKPSPTATANPVSSTFNIKIVNVTGAGTPGSIPAMSFKGYYSDSNNKNKVTASQNASYQFTYTLKANWQYLPEYSNIMKSPIVTTSVSGSRITFKIDIKSGNVLYKDVFENIHLVFGPKETYGIPTLLLNLDRKISEDWQESKLDWVNGTYAMIDGTTKKYGTVSQKGTLRMKGRGSSSWNTVGVAFDKYPYTMKLDEKGALLNLPENKDWNLIPSISDKSMLRNYFAYTVGQKMNFWYEPKCQHIDVYLDNEYKGTYLLVEKMEVANDKISITETEPGDLKSAMDFDNLSFMLEAEPRERGSKGDLVIISNDVQYNVKSPDKDIFAPNSNYQATKNTIISDAIVRYMNTAYNNLRNNNIDYIDIDSFVDAYILQEFARNVDGGMQLSTFFYKDKHNNKLYVSVWDFDIAFGNCFYGGEPTEGYMIKDAKWFRYLMNNSTFKSRLKSRYQELRKGLLSNSNIDSIINSQANLIRTSANKNYQWLKYSRDFYYGDAGIQVYKGQVAINTFVWPNPQSVIAQNSFDKQVNWLKNWMHERLAWMDRNIPYM